MNEALQAIEIFGQHFALLPAKALLWQEQNILLLADLHLGKAGHFRSRGIPIPQEVLQKDLDCLGRLLEEFRPARTIFLGDLFHSSFNYEWKIFEEWRNGFHDLSLELVRGNHDILNEIHYRDLHIHMHGNFLELEHFIFTHKPLAGEDIADGRYAFCGHIHPAVRLSGRGRQQLLLPCFYFGQRQCILPSFGNFTGSAQVFPKRGERVFVISDETVIEIPVG